MKSRFCLTIMLPNPPNYKTSANTRYTSIAQQVISHPIYKTIVINPIVSVILWVVCTQMLSSMNRHQFLFM